MSANPPTIQSLIRQLETYWNKQGCLLLQTESLPMGAATFHPATFLRAIGPEPWRCVYTQGCRRPADGRYGDNPNRLQHYYQLQVALKPPPEDVQALYLDSLKTLGIAASQHDVRFIEDDWESPTLGAWGLGWEVRLDGMEISQFTYFQQVGGLECKPASCEITYGVERLALSLQAQHKVFDLLWDRQGDQTVLYRDVFHQNEREQSAYNFEHADVSSLVRQFNDCEQACRLLVEKELPLPAYEQVVLASHAFNLLEARRALSAAERQRYVLRTRGLARAAAELYLGMREADDFPLLKRAPAAVNTGEKLIASEAKTFAAEQLDRGNKTLLIEIGCEELPASRLPQLGATLVSELIQKIRAAEFAIGDNDPIRTLRLQTPRRIVLYIEKLFDNDSSFTTTSIRSGPKLEHALNKDGTPNEQGKGFARSCGVDFSKLKHEQGRLVYIEPSKPKPNLDQCLPEILQRAVKETMKKIGGRTMHWDAKSQFQFARPIRWLCILYGRQVVDAELYGVRSGRETYGHRHAGRLAIRLEHAGQYEEALKKKRNGNVVLDFKERRQLIEQQLEKAAADAAEAATCAYDHKQLETAAAMTESPHAMRAQFEVHYLALPDEVIVAALKDHLSAFTLRDQRGRLLPYFICILDGEIEDLEPVRQAYERVVSARLNDAKFFYERDRQQTLAEREKALDGLVFQKPLGHYADKAKRLQKLMRRLAPAFGIDGDNAERSARLCKCDLLSEVVGEFPALQGVMGGFYARKDGEQEAVAEAISEHYRPAYADDGLPSNMGGLALSLADKTDTFIGLLGAGYKLDSSRDPYGLRRMAAGIVRILFEEEIDLDLKGLLHAAWQGYDQSIKNCTAQAFHYLLARLHAYLISIEKDTGSFRYESGVITSEVLMKKPSHWMHLKQKVSALQDFIEQRPEAAELVMANKRIANILEQGEGGQQEVAEAELTMAAEKNLYQACEKVRGLYNQRKYEQVMTKLAELPLPINRFLDEVMVMSENQRKRNNRLALLYTVRELSLQMEEFIEQCPEAAELVMANKRIANILKKSGRGHQEVAEAELTMAAEKDLYQAYQKCAPFVRRHYEQRKYKQALMKLAELHLPINRFFDEVMVMSENRRERANRLALLYAVRELFLQMADFRSINTHACKARHDRH